MSTISLAPLPATYTETTEALHESLNMQRWRLPVVQWMLPFRMPRWPGSGSWPV